MPRPAPVRAPLRRPGGEPEGRLAFAEFLLGCDEARDCGQWALDWLAEQMGVRQALCLVPDDDVTQLVPLAGYGVPAARLQRLIVNLDDRDDPLVAALEGSAAVVVPSNGTGRSTRSPLTAPFLAVPLGGGDSGSDRIPGLLLIAPPSAEVTREAAWVADVLGIKLGKLLAARSLASVNRRLERERAVLHTVMNAVQDPILLTDSEGRMILTNARAEALFAATD